MFELNLQDVSKRIEKELALFGVFFFSYFTLYSQIGCNATRLIFVRKELAKNEAKKYKYHYLQKKYFSVYMNRRREREKERKKKNLNNSLTDKI